MSPCKTFSAVIASTTVSGRIHFLFNMAPTVGWESTWLIAVSKIAIVTGNGLEVMMEMEDGNKKTKSSNWICHS